jgi:hypothetical protein
MLYPSYKWLGLTPLTPAMAMCWPLHLLHLLRAGSAMGQWEFQDPKIEVLSTNFEAIQTGKNPMDSPINRCTRRSHGAGQRLLAPNGFRLGAPMLWLGLSP